jgi:hypothetical protein
MTKNQEGTLPASNPGRKSRSIARFEYLYASCSNFYSRIVSCA